MPSLKSAIILLVFTAYAFLQSAVAQVLHKKLTDTLHHTTDTLNHDTIIKTSEPISHSKITKVDSLIQFAYSFLGNRYRRGGTSNKGFDCSGYTMTVFKQFNIRLPHTSAGQGLVGIEVRKEQINKGDLIFFRGRNMRSKRIGHVGIVISEKGDPVRFIHSSTTEGVRIDRLDFEYYKKRYVKTVRINQLH